MRPGETQTVPNAADRYFINPGAAAIIALIIIRVLFFHVSLLVLQQALAVSYSCISSVQYVLRTCCRNMLFLQLIYQKNNGISS